MHDRCGVLVTAGDVRLVGPPCTAMHGQWHYRSCRPSGYLQRASTVPHSIANTAATQCINCKRQREIRASKTITLHRRCFGIRKMMLVYAAGLRLNQSAPDVS